MNKNQDWKKWNYEDEINSLEKSRNSLLLTKKFKFFLLFFTVLILTLLNFKILEVLSLADGKVIPQGRIKYIQHLEGGIVEEILVKEGEKVKTDQSLVILSKAKASSEYEEINTRLKSIELSIIRIDSEKKSLNEIPKFFTQGKFEEELVKFENEFLSSRKNNLNSEQKTMKKNIKNLEKRYSLIKEQTLISEELLLAEATNRFKHLELLRELSNVEGQLEEQKNKLETITLNFNEQLNIELSQLNKEKSELLKRITKYSDNLSRTILKSPVNGIVKLISVNSKGAIIAPGVTVVEIVPENEKLIIEAKLPLSEIGFVKNGLDAKIRLNSPEGSRFKPINGKVVFVGADRVSSKDSDGYYLVKIETEETSFYKDNEVYVLYPGIPVIAGIITGNRSFLDYFMTPLKQNISFALSER